VVDSPTIEKVVVLGMFPRLPSKSLKPAQNQIVIERSRELNAKLNERYSSTGASDEKPKKVIVSYKDIGGSCLVKEDGLSPDESCYADNVHLNQKGLIQSYILIIR